MKSTIIIFLAFTALLVVGVGCPAPTIPPGAVQAPIVVQPPVVYIYATMPAINVPPGAVSIVFPPGAIQIQVQIGDKAGPLVSNSATITVSPHLLGATAPATQRSER